MLIVDTRPLSTCVDSRRVSYVRRQSTQRVLIVDTRPLSTCVDSRRVSYVRRQSTQRVLIVDTRPLRYCGTSLEWPLDRKLISNDDLSICNK